MSITRQQAAQELLNRRKARRSLVDYARYVEVPGSPVEEQDEDSDLAEHFAETVLAKHHVLILEAAQRCIEKPYGRLMIFMPPGSAKALALDTPIPTPDGWKMMGDLRVGDKVFDENGLPCDVTWVSPIWRNRPVYSVTTDCGDTIIADRDHEWLVRLCGKRPVFKIKETHELCKARSKRPMITRAKPLALPMADLPVDPYLLGVWLGDGNSSGIRITSSIEDQPWLRSEIERLGYKTSNSRSPTLFGVLGVRGEFVKLGLVNDPAHNTHGRKHIPGIYMRASIEQRLALLQGLVDTDGTVCRERGCTTFCSTNKELAIQVRELVRSLGVKAGWSEGRAMLNGKDCGPVFRVGFYLKGSARMPRKAALTRDQYRTPNTYIDVEPHGIADTVCIEVNSPSHLFLCGRSMTPTHNSTYGSVVVPSWAMGQKPGFKVIGVSYGSDMAKKFGRRTRSIIKQSKYRALFSTSLSGDQAAADEWALENGSEYMSGGVLSGITGNRADLVVIDDPIRGRQDADSEVIRQRTWDEYQESVLTRLKPSGSVMIIQCMTGDTGVMMADKTEKLLRDINVGDIISTYDKGKLSTSRVINWSNNGSDCIFAIKMKSGIIVRANGRHPFLVNDKGVPVWKRLKDLRRGNEIFRVNGENGRVKRASTKDAKSLSGAEVIAHPTITRKDGQTVLGLLPQTQNQEGRPISDIGMGLTKSITTGCSRTRDEFAQSANSHQAKRTQERIGTESCALTTAMTVRTLEGCCATTATLRLDMERNRKSLKPQQNISDFITDEIVDIYEDGYEDVFDIQVERTENFIANGLVSHNTRWHEDDLSGRILPDNYAGESGMIMGKDGFEWEVICLAAECERADDPLGRKIGEMIWPEWFDEKHWQVHRKNPRTWSALFQQRPAPDSGDYFKKEWIKLVSASQVPPLNTMSIYGASDYAVTNNGGDYTVHVVVGVDSEGRVWLLDIWRQQASSDRWVDSFCDLVRKWKPIGWAEETGQIKSGVGPFLVKRMLETGSYVAREQFPTRGGDKSVRAQSIRGRIALSGLYVRDDLPGLDALMSEMMSFPVGVHDDQVDALGLVGQLMDRMTPGKPQKKPERMDYSAVYASPLPGQRKRG